MFNSSFLTKLTFSIISFGGISSSGFAINKKLFPKKITEGEKKEVKDSSNSYILEVITVFASGNFSCWYDKEYKGIKSKCEIPKEIHLEKLGKERYDILRGNREKVEKHISTYYTSKNNWNCLEKNMEGYDVLKVCTGGIIKVI